MSNPLPDPGNRTAAEWGLAGALMGGVLVVLALGMLILDLLLGGVGRTYMGRADAAGAFVGAVLGVGASLLLSGFACFCGVRSLPLASRLAQPAALGLVGLLLGVRALGTWVGAALATFMTLGMMLR